MTDLRFLDPEAQVNRAAFNERFDLLNQLMFGLGNQYLWEKTHIAYETKPTEISFCMLWGMNSTPSTQYTVVYADSINLDNSGIISGVEPVTVSGTRDEIMGLSETLKGKYVYLDANGRTTQSGYSDEYPAWYLIPADANIFISGANNAVICQNPKLISVVSSVIQDGYVNSSDPSAYPPAEPDGYTYTALGQVGSKVRIETGDYVGTGTYNSDNPNTLTFGFAPKLIIIGCQQNINISGSGSPAILILISPAMRGNYISPDTGLIALTTWIGTKVSWHSTTNEGQMNQANMRYYYIALG